MQDFQTVQRICVPSHLFILATQSLPKLKGLVQMWPQPVGELMARHASDPLVRRKGSHASLDLGLSKEPTDLVS